jgi:hypothetical protein
MPIGLETGGRRAIYMRVRSLLRSVVLAALVALAWGVLAATAPADGRGQRALVTAKCARVKVRATPALNTAMIPETIKSRVTSCSSRREVVTLVQTMTSDTASKWRINLSPGQTVVKIRSLPYACCGTYRVTDRLRTTSGKQLAKATGGFTFA